MLFDDTLIFELFFDENEQISTFDFRIVSLEVYCDRKNSHK
jgi:hypothetical protein